MSTKVSTVASWSKIIKPGFNGRLWLQGAAVFTFGLILSLFLPYSTWQLYSNVCIIITLTAKYVGRLNLETV